MDSNASSGVSPLVVEVLETVVEQSMQWSWCLLRPKELGRINAGEGDGLMQRFLKPLHVKDHRTSAYHSVLSVDFLRL